MSELENGPYFVGVGGVCFEFTTSTQRSCYREYVFQTAYQIIIFNCNFDVNYLNLGTLIQVAQV